MFICDTKIVEDNNNLLFILGVRRKIFIDKHYMFRTDLRCAYDSNVSHISFERNMKIKLCSIKQYRSDFPFQAPGVRRQEADAKCQAPTFGNRSDFPKLISYRTKYFFRMRKNVFKILVLDGENIFWMEADTCGVIIRLNFILLSKINLNVKKKNKKNSHFFREIFPLRF